MNILLTYLAIGAGCLAVILVARAVRKPHPLDSIRQKLEAMDPNYGKLSYRIMNGVVGPTVAAVFTVAVWPLAIYLQVRAFRRADGNSSRVALANYTPPDREKLDEMIAQQLRCLAERRAAQAAALKAKRG